MGSDRERRCYLKAHSKLVLPLSWLSQTVNVVVPICTGKGIAELCCVRMCCMAHLLVFLLK